MREPKADGATRWLRLGYRAGAALDAVATIGMMFPGRLWTARFRQPFDRDGPELAYGRRAGAPLMAGWTVLLLWADRRPAERKDVIVLTAVPVVVGLMAADTVAVRAGHLDARSILPTRVAQVALLAVFTGSYLRARALDR